MEMTNLENFMDDALNAAREALLNGEVPVGCVFVYENEIISSGRNFVNETKNATRHAELICVDKILQFCTDKNLNYKSVFNKISVVVTVEPCIMCAAALHQLYVKEIIYGCANDRFGGTTAFKVQNILMGKIPIRGGVRANEAMELLKQFYKGVNPAAPCPKIKKEIK